MEHILLRLRANLVEALVPVLAVGSVLEALLVGGVHHRLAVAICALFWSVPFFWWRRNPVLAPSVVTTALLVLGIVDGKDTRNLALPFTAAILCAVSFGMLADLPLRLAGWCAVAGTAMVVDYKTSGAAGDYFWTTLIVTIAWCFGVAFGSRTTQARELRARVVAESARAAAAAADERGRIARELHDVVAHSISVMVVQAAGVRRHLSSDQEREREALLSVEQTGREALGEMRRMLGLMRSGEELQADLAPQPSLRHLDRLVAQTEEAGLPVTLRLEGERVELAPGIDVSAYRIVQEALAGSRGTHAEVLVRYGGERVEIEVSDDGTGVNGNALDALGLVGMRERITLFGGTLEVGPRDGGGFLLRAQLPVGGDS